MSILALKYINQLEHQHQGQVQVIGARIQLNENQNSTTGQEVATDLD